MKIIKTANKLCKFRIIYAIIALLLYNTEILNAQEEKKDTNWMGVWDEHLEFVGIFSEDKLYDYNDTNLKLVEDDGMNGRMRKLLSSTKKKRLYILITKDTMTITKTKVETSKIILENPSDKWLNGYNEYTAYLKDSQVQLIEEFLPDGHWKLFSLEEGKEGVYIEKFVKEKKLYNYFILYDLDTGKDLRLVKYYYEIENNLLNGLFIEQTKEYVYNYPINKTNKVLRFKEGELVEEIYYSEEDE